jgi:predicted nucleic-acid-binding protein
MHAVDTNVVVRLLVRDDPGQTRAAEEFCSRGAWVSHLVFVETVWVLDAVYRRSVEQIASAIGMLLSHQYVTLQDADLVSAAFQLFRKRPALGFSECLVLATARRAGHLPLGTFDRNLARLEGAQRLG